MKNFCTVADSNFYDRVSALESSLTKVGEDFKIHLLCLDDIIANKINNKNIICYNIKELKEKDKTLRASENNPPSREALINSGGDQNKAKKLQFIWSLSAYFSWWCLENLNLKDILYIDADIYFYKNLNTLYDKLDNGGINIGIVEHRCPYNPANGRYNVGIVYFKNNFEGYKCCTWWKNCLLTTDHQFYKTHSSCGDQKYLELFSKLFKGVSVLDKSIGHLAPWNFNFHQYNKEKIIWNNMEQELVYCHFSNFKIVGSSYELAPRHGFKVAPNKFVQNIADEYFQCLKGFVGC